MLKPSDVPPVVATPPTIRLTDQERRYLVVQLLLEAGRPMTVSELVSRWRDLNIEVYGDRHSQLISNHLRGPCNRGWVRRLRRGVYVVGHVPRGTQYRMRIALDRAFLRPHPSLPPLPLLPESQ